MPDIQAEVGRKIVPLTQHLLDARMPQRTNTALAEFVAALLPFFLRLAAGIVLVGLSHHLGGERPRSIRDGSEVEEPPTRRLPLALGRLVEFLVVGEEAD